MTYLEDILERLRFKGFSDCGTYLDLSNGLLHIRLINETSIIEITMFIKDAYILDTKQLELFKINQNISNVSKHFFPLSDYLDIMINKEEVQ